MSKELVTHGNNVKLPGVGKISRLMLSGEFFGLEPTDIRYGDPVRACEVCGRERPSSDMINLILTIGSPGHHTLPPFQHPEIEHWACSIEHWNALVLRVKQEINQLLSSLHIGVEGSVHDASIESE